MMTPRNLTELRTSRATVRRWCAGGWWYLCAGLLALTVLPVQAQTRPPPSPGEYRITGGKVDRGTYLGWRLFHTACYGCHGLDATGTDLAPNLVERVKLMSPRAFATKVLTSYRIADRSNDPNADDSVASREAMIDDVMRGQRDGRSRIVMPAWELDSKVEPHVLDLFAYLTARADGKLGPGRPKWR